MATQVEGMVEDMAEAKVLMEEVEANSITGMEEVLMDTQMEDQIMELLLGLTIPAFLLILSGMKIEFLLFKPIQVVKISDNLTQMEVIMVLPNSHISSKRFMR